MAGKKWQAGGNGANPAWSAAFVLMTMMPFTAASALPANFDYTVSFGATDPILLWQFVIGGVVALAFLIAAILWTVAALNRMKRAFSHGTALVTTALNTLSHGVVIVSRQDKVVFCNNRYLEIYGLARADITRGITGTELIALRRSRGIPEVAGPGGSYAVDANGMVVELVNGRSILMKRYVLPNGNAVATYEDCTEQRDLAKQLASANSFLESIIDNVPVCIAAKSVENGRYIFANRAFERFSGFSRDMIVGKRVEELYTPATAAALDAADRKAIESPTGRTSGEIHIQRNGRPCVLANNRVLVRNQDNEPEFLVALFDDVTERVSLSEQLENAKAFLELVVDHIPIAVTVESIDDRRYLLANRRAETILNRRREDVTGLTSAELFNPREASVIISRDDAAIKKGGMQTEEHPISTKDGLRLFLTRRVTVAGETGGPQYLIKTHEDVTDRRQTEARMAHMAYHDGLTDLPNRPAFLQALAQMIEACEGTDEKFAVLSVDLDGLKEINDVFGHAIGDKLLVEVSQRIQNAARGGVVARLSGDEFGLIIDGSQPEAALTVANRLVETMADEFRIDGKSVRTGLTTGIAIFPANGTDAASLLANAGAALFRAKARSRGSINIYEPEMDRQVRDRRVLHQDLSMAIRNGELSLHYQPQARASRDEAGRETIGFEALARWNHPTRGSVPPSDFIPLAEESGLIVEMGQWILREACREAASWPKPLQIAVNLSPAQFMHSDLVNFLHAVLLETGLAPGRLELEITEGVLIEDFDRGLGLLRRLKALGVRISMDDFGSGYSSLTYLQAFPFDKIKVDRAFVMNLGHTPQSAAIIRAVIGLGHGLHMSIVAEGVETYEQLGFLADESCDVIQGFFIGRPAPIEQYAALVGRAVPRLPVVGRKAS
ncbi:MAG: EAL domain-containing protein [Rhizobiales bacterium]|nr:EAL domain-containing protein [Hyphomicrobiales bacterium]